ncbi:MAG: Arc family DNA binding domain-containing protein [Gammaproteobacteria bacterium]|nr:Arc family DNA binding domain-containing protein [Gammaproteobacteria bacterium]
MAKRKSFALRIDSRTLDAMQRWAKDDLRSLNAQIEYVLREAMRKSGRLPKRQSDDDRTGGDDAD